MSDPVGSIYLGKRILKIGHQTFTLSTICRVQMLRVEWRRGAPGASGLLRLALLVGALLIGVPVLASAVGIRLGTSFTSLLLIGVLIVAGVLVYRALARHRRYVLAIETAGGQSTALASKDIKGLRSLEEAVVEALENPPDTGRHLHVQNLVLADKVEGGVYQQSGDSSAMNVNQPANQGRPW